MCKKSPEENGQLRIKVEGKTILSQVKPFFQSVVFHLKVLGDVEFELDRGRTRSYRISMETLFQVSKYAPGDINGTKMLAHAAFRMGEIRRQVMPSKETMLCCRASELWTPAAIYTLPEVVAGRSN